MVGAAILAAVYCYLHFYLQRLWRTLAMLPAIFPDGVALDDKTDPWLLTNLVRPHVPRVPARPLGWLEHQISAVLAWWLVPFTLLGLWSRYLPAHGWKGTVILVLLIGFTILFGRHAFPSCPGDTCPADARRLEQACRASTAGLPNSRAARAGQTPFRDRLAASLTVGLAVCSISAFRDNPRDPYTWVAKGLNAFNFIGIRTYADLREVDVAQKPDDWDGKDWRKVKRVDLRGRNLAFADAERAFLANADLRDADLPGADLSFAQLQGAKLLDAQLQGANLSHTEFQNSDFSGADVRGADLSECSCDTSDASADGLIGSIHDQSAAVAGGADRR